MENELICNVVSNIEKVIIGKRTEIYQIIKGIIAGGHILIEDVPGTGKTTLVKTLSKTMNLKYSRIQFTPDLLPSDVTGVSIFNRKSEEFEFRKGPIFANIILADEINRTSPKTQSALLEVMEENQISEGNFTYKLEKPFIVLATQNPVEYQGTFALPEAQLDRFMLKVKIGYASEKSESDILQIYRNNNPIQDIIGIMNSEQILKIQEQVRNIYASREITDYIVKIVGATRVNKYIILGGSTRASIAMMRIGQATAYLKGRDYVVPEDIKENAVSVLSHRITLSPSARVDNYSSEDVINEILDKVHPPVMNTDFSGGSK